MKLDGIMMGYDGSEDKAYKVADYSFKKHNNQIKVYPLIQDQLRYAGVYTRPYDEPVSTSFSFTRFLTPYLSRQLKLNKWVMFVDCDMLCTSELKLDLDPSMALYVVQHDYTPTTDTKMDGKIQVPYKRKNWSSVMIFNVNHPALDILTPDFVNTANGKDLHQLTWIDDKYIGKLSPDYNFLVGEYQPNEDTSTYLPTPLTPSILHYTLGTPTIFETIYTKDYSNIWETYYTEMLEYQCQLQTMYEQVSSKRK